MNQVYYRYQIPIMVVENGLGTAMDILNPNGTVHDPYRIEYLREHISQMKEAIHDGVELIGYTSWAASILSVQALAKCRNAMDTSM